jgi:hypothetical protein
MMIVDRNNAYLNGRYHYQMVDDILNELRHHLTQDQLNITL